MSSSKRNKQPCAGFTMTEVLLAISTICLVAILAVPKLNNSRRQEPILTAMNFVSSIRGALDAKKNQIVVYCNPNAKDWPRL